MIDSPVLLLSSIQNTLSFYYVTSSGYLPLDSQQQTEEMGMNELSVSVGAGRRKQHRQGGQPTAGWSCFRAPLDSLLSGAVLQS